GGTRDRTAADMSDTTFLRHSAGLTLEEIGALTGAAPVSAPHSRRIVNIAPLDRASPSDLTFFDSRNFSKAAAATPAVPCLTMTALAKELPARVAILTVREPYRAFVTAARALFPHALRPSSLSNAGDFSQAHVDKSALTEDGVTIEAGAVVGPRAEIGSGRGVSAHAGLCARGRVGGDRSIGGETTGAGGLVRGRGLIHPRFQNGAAG